MLPQHFCFRFKIYKARKQLTAIDWNYHLKRSPATTTDNEIQCTRKYNQRTKEWNSKVVKVKKNYNYIPMLLAKIFSRRMYDVDHIVRHVSLSEEDPARIAPNIGHKQPESSRELYLKKQSRFPKCKINLFESKESG